MQLHKADFKSVESSKIILKYNFIQDLLRKFASVN